MEERQAFQPDAREIPREPKSRSATAYRMPNWIYTQFCLNLTLAAFSGAPGKGQSELPDGTTIDYYRPTLWSGYRAFSRWRGVKCLNYERVFDDQLPDWVPPEAAGNVSAVEIVDTTEVGGDESSEEESRGSAE